MGENTGIAMDEAARFRDFAARCRHLAAATVTKQTVEVLRQLAEDYDRKADELEQLRAAGNQQGQDSPPAGAPGDAPPASSPPS